MTTSPYHTITLWPEPDYPLTITATPLGFKRLSVLANAVADQLMGIKSTSPLDIKPEHEIPTKVAGSDAITRPWKA